MTTGESRGTRTPAATIPGPDMSAAGVTATTPSARAARITEAEDPQAGGAHYQQHSVHPARIRALLQSNGTFRRE